MFDSSKIKRSCAFLFSGRLLVQSCVKFDKADPLIREKVAIRTVTTVVSRSFDMNTFNVGEVVNANVIIHTEDD